MVRNTKLLTSLAAGIAASLGAAAQPASAEHFEEVFAVRTAIIIPGAPLNSWDISFVDPTLGLFLLGDRTNNAVDLVNTRTNTFAGFLGQGRFTGPVPCPPDRPGGANDCSGPDGVLVVNHREVWVGDGDSTVKVFDLALPLSAPPTHTISTGGVHRADELCWDPDHHLVLVANNAEDPFPFASVISTDTYAVLKKITFDGTAGSPRATNGIEQCVYSRRTGRFYIAVPEVNGAGNNSSPGGVAVINPLTFSGPTSVEAVFVVPRTSCVGPQGMALGPEFQALLGCNGANAAAGDPTAIIDIRNGSVIATLPNQSGSDEVWYNPGDGHYFLARSAAVGANQLLGVIDARGPRADQSIVTARTGAPNSHSIAVDPVRNQVYVAIGRNNSNVCSTALGGNPAADAQGCIAVFRAKKDERCLAEGAPIISANDDDNSEFLTGPCDNDDERNR